MTETCAAYIAGLIDADGHISMRRNNLGTPWANTAAFMGIVNKDLPTLQWVQSVFGGFVRKRSMDRKSPHARMWSQTWDWIPDAAGIEFALESVLPYLRIKKRQAEIALEFLKTRQDRKLQYRLTPEVKARREELYMEIKSLNRTGAIAAIVGEVN